MAKGRSGRSHDHCERWVCSGQAAVDRAALVDLVVRFSELMMVLKEEIAEIDLNPVIVGYSGCTIVDALVVPVSGD